MALDQIVAIMLAKSVTFPPPPKFYSNTWPRKMDLKTCPKMPFSVVLKSPSFQEPTKLTREKISQHSFAKHLESVGLFLGFTVLGGLCCKMIWMFSLFLFCFCIFGSQSFPAEKAKCVVFLLTPLCCCPNDTVCVTSSGLFLAKNTCGKRVFKYTTIP